jgi:hypothetical protein
MGSTARWLNEREVAARSGLPGPLVAELLPQLPVPPGIAYDRTAALYTADSVIKAQIAVYMLAAGIRCRYIRAAMFEPASPAQLERDHVLWRKTSRLLLTRKRPRARAGIGTLRRSGRWLTALLTAARAALSNPFNGSAQSLPSISRTSTQHRRQATPRVSPTERRNSCH